MQMGKPTEQGVAAIARMLEAMLLMSLHTLAQARKQTIPSLLHDITGLSKARISKGNRNALRPSTQAKVVQHMEALLQEHFEDDTEGLQNFRGWISAAPSTRSGALAPFASWVYQFEVLPPLRLPITKDVALTIDELLEALHTCCRNEDFQNFKSLLLAHVERHGRIVRSAELGTPDAMPEEELAALYVASNWEQAERWVRNLLEQLYWDLISTLDAEWSSHYFSGRKIKPLFPLVMVRPQEGLMESMKVTSRKNIYFKPVRRLLEFLYALAFYRRYRRWPSKAPKPATLAGILYRPGSDELADESLISNYFDGTTKVTLDLVQEHWQQLLQHFMPKRTENERPTAPFPMIMLALQWQALLALDSGRSFFMPDMMNYGFVWRFRRRQWEALQAQYDSGFSSSGQRVDETMDWPEWAVDQSSSSSSV